MTESPASATAWFKNSLMRNHPLVPDQEEITHLYNVFLNAVCRPVESDLGYAYAFFDISRYVSALARVRIGDPNAVITPHIEQHVDRINHILQGYGMVHTEFVLFTTLLDDLKTIGFDEKLFTDTILKVRLSSLPT